MLNWQIHVFEDRVTCVTGKASEDGERRNAEDMRERERERERMMEEEKRKQKKKREMCCIYKKKGREEQDIGNTAREDTRYRKCVEFSTGRSPGQPITVQLLFIELPELP
mmetsp:Transcript_9291/g.15982  ORF Transcript_9291/g.15982 Transcript_9291/m.15982 type:complete len:110 (-) Transcript_9291:1332-1661(-)